MPILKSSIQTGNRGEPCFIVFPNTQVLKTSILKPIISNAIIGKYLGYFIILQQMSFVPLVIWKKTRKYAILLSVLIHLTMLIQFGLWKFELVVILLYGFLLNDEEWKELIPRKFHEKFFST